MMIEMISMTNMIRHSDNDQKYINFNYDDSDTYNTRRKYGLNFFYFTLILRLKA